nr:DUF222 domain-containing protein [Jiangella aurantiaca]
MFEEAPLTAPLPGDGPVVEGWVVWPPYDDPGVGDIDPALLRELCTGGSVPVIADADAVPVGPELAALLARFDPATADAHDLVEALAGCARLAAWVAAREAAASAELASRPQLRPDVSGYRSVNPVTNTAVEVAARCQVTTRQTETQVGHALQLVEDFPDTHAALEVGVIDVRRARVITDELGGQEPDVRVRVEAAVLPKAPYLDSAALRKLIKRLLHELAPVETAVRHRAARERRYVAVTPAGDGMAHLQALLPADDATAVDTALNAAAADAKRADAAAGHPARTRDQRRADVLAGLGWAALAACTHAATGSAADPDTAGGNADGGHPADVSADADAGGGRWAGRAGRRRGLARPGRVRRWHATAATDQRARHRPVRHGHRAQRRTRRARRLRTRPRPRRPHPGRRGRVDLAAHRPRHPAAPRPRPHQVPAHHSARGVHHRPGPDLPGTGLPPHGPELRPRPRDPVRRRRHHLRGEPPGSVHHPSPAQTPRPLDRPPTTRRHHPMDQPHRPPLPKTTRGQGPEHRASARATP